MAPERVAHARAKLAATLALRQAIAQAGLPCEVLPDGVSVRIDEATVYGDAFAALKAGRFDEAVRGFQLYLTKYPQGPRADNAAYWLGESHYVAKDFESAQNAFQSVLDDYPDSRKSPDAMLKIGYCQYEVKAYKNARTTLERVVAEYPGTEAARLAQARVTMMDVEGR